VGRGTEHDRLRGLDCPRMATRLQTQSRLRGRIRRSDSALMTRVLERYDHEADEHDRAAADPHHFAGGLLIGKRPAAANMHVMRVERQAIGVEHEAEKAGQRHPQEHLTEPRDVIEAIGSNTGAHISPRRERVRERIAEISLKNAPLGGTSGTFTFPRKRATGFGGATSTYGHELKGDHAQNEDLNDCCSWNG